MLICLCPLTLQLQGSIYPSHTIKMPSSISRLVSFFLLSCLLDLYLNWLEFYWFWLTNFCFLFCGFDTSLASLQFDDQYFLASSMDGLVSLFFGKLLLGFIFNTTSTWRQILIICCRISCWGICVNSFWIPYIYIEMNF